MMALRLSTLVILVLVSIDIGHAQQPSATSLLMRIDHLVYATPDLNLGIDAIESATFLSPKQKRDILYDNAARFLRLTPEQIASHHGR